MNERTLELEAGLTRLLTLAHVEYALAEQIYRTENGDMSENGSTFTSSGSYLLFGDYANAMFYKSIGDLGKALHIVYGMLYTADVLLEDLTWELPLSEDPVIADQQFQFVEKLYIDLIHRNPFAGLNYVLVSDDIEPTLENASDADGEDLYNRYFIEFFREHALLRMQEEFK